MRLVVQQGCIDRFRAIQMIQDKAQSADNGASFSRAVTPYWIIWVAPFGRVVKRSSTVLRLLARTRHYRRDAPSGQPLHNSLNPSIQPCCTTSVVYRNYWPIQPDAKRLAARHAPAGVVSLPQGGITQRMAALRLAESAINYDAVH